MSKEPLDPWFCPHTIVSDSDKEGQYSKVCVCVCVCGIVCFPFCAGSVCMKERKKKTHPHIRRVAAFIPTPGWLWHCEQVAGPSNNQNILYLVAISPHLA